MVTFYRRTKWIDIWLDKCVGPDEMRLLYRHFKVRVDLMAVSLMKFPPTYISNMLYRWQQHHHVHCEPHCNYSTSEQSSARTTKRHTLHTVSSPTMRSSHAHLITNDYCADSCTAVFFQLFFCSVHAFSESAQPCELAHKHSDSTDMVVLCYTLE